MKEAISAAAWFLLICTVSVSAQWGRFQDPSVPRDAQGRVRMDAPPPRMADGKPDNENQQFRRRIKVD